LQAKDWWEAVSLFLWMYCVASSGLLLFYFHGICRLSERKFKGRTYAWLLIPFYLLFSAGTLLFHTSSSLSPHIRVAIWPWIASFLLLFVVYRTYRVMMG
jgi:hypothetical protein